jgi:hypothetical protein
MSVAIDTGQRPTLQLAQGIRLEESHGAGADDENWRFLRWIRHFGKIDERPSKDPS